MPELDEEQLKAQLEFIKKLEKEKEGEMSTDLATLKGDLHIKLKYLVDNLVKKIQEKHESLIDSQKQLTSFHEELKNKYNPIFD